MLQSKKKSFGSIPSKDSLKRSLEWETVSKAFAKSIKIRSIWPLSLRIFEMSCVKAMSCVRVECFGRKPCCVGVKNPELSRKVRRLSARRRSKSLQDDDVREIGR